MTFWLIATALTLFVVLWLILPLLRSGDVVDSDESPDIRIYRDQLAEIENDLARGVLSESEAERTRLEISRRLLEADKASAGRKLHVAGGLQSKILAGVTVFGVLVASAGIYWKLGARGAPDLPLAKRHEQMAEARAARPPQAQVEAQIGNVQEMADAADEAYKTLVAELREAVAQRPGDLRGYELLADHEARLGNFAAARMAKGMAIEIKGDSANADDYTDYAELMIIAAGGYVSPIAEQALASAIKMRPDHSRARYYSGLDLAQNGRPDLAYKIWTDLLEKGPETAPWINPIRQQIADVARLAGLRAPDLPGPSRDQIEDAENLSESERQDMIRGMVAQLSARLASEGGTASEWARLINAYGVLGETERAAAIWAEAQSVFEGDPIAMKELSQAAQSAGVAK